MEKGNLKWEELESKISKSTNKKVEEDEELSQEVEDVETKRIKQKNSKKLMPIIIVGILIILLLIFSTIFSFMNLNNDKIVSGVKIENIDVAGLSKDEAKSKIESIYNEKKQKDINLKYQDFETTINPELIETNYNTDKAIEEAINIGKDGNIFSNNYNILFAMMGKKNIEVEMTINEEEAKNKIEEIGSNIPGIVVEPGYSIEGNKLIITNGKEGIKIDTENLIKKLKLNLKDINNKEQNIEIPVINKEPEEINIEKIYEEVHKEVKDAYYTKEPFTIYPEVEGVDFNLEEAKTILQEEKEQYEIELTITKPKVTIAQIGSEAFPDLLGTYSTKYDGGNTDRTTNLRIACRKINDKVVLPGETFSYNKTLGERTPAAGYKNAKVYENGEVVDGIGGGICQISSTLYNSVLKANMDIVERRNHQFVTSYTPAGRDATVVYGLTDFKFKNTRKTAVRIKASCSNGIATVSIYGIKDENEYDVSFNTKTISTIPFTVKYVDDNSLPAGTEKVKQKGANGIITETYIVKSLNGKVVSSNLLSKDTYNAMQRIILRGTNGTQTNLNTNNVQNNQPTQPVQQTQPAQQTQQVTEKQPEQPKQTEEKPAENKKDDKKEETNTNSETIKTMVENN